MRFEGGTRDEEEEERRQKPDEIADSNPSPIL